MKNEYIPQLSTIKEVIRHTDLEYTFRMEYTGEKEVKPGQFLRFPAQIRRGPDFSQRNRQGIGGFYHPPRGKGDE